MAQPLWNRILAAQGEKATLVDRRATLEEAEQELINAQAAQKAAQERRLDPGLSPDEARDADLEAREHELNAMRLERAIEKLRDIIRGIEEKMERAEKRRRYEAAKAERDELVADLKERIPPLFDELVELFDRIEVNDAELGIVNNGQGADGWLESAEAVARGCPGNFYRGGVPINRLTQIRLPSFDSNESGGLWPVDKAALALSRQQDREAVQRRAAKVRATAEAERWAWCAIVKPKGEQVTIETRRGRKPASREPIHVELDAEQIAEARKQGVIVERAAIVRLTGPRGGGMMVQSVEGEKWPGETPLTCAMTGDQIVHARNVGAGVEIISPADPDPNAEKAPAKAEAA